MKERLAKRTLAETSRLCFVSTDNRIVNDSGRWSMQSFQSNLTSLGGPIVTIFLD